MNRMIIALTLFDSISFMDWIKEKKLHVYNIQKEKETINLETSFLTFLKIKKKYKDVRIIKDNIISRKYKELSKTICAFICLILSLSLLFIAEERIFYISVNGISPEINGEIIKELEERGIKKYEKKPLVKNLDLITKDIHNKFIDRISVMSITIEGVYINVNYQKRKEPVYIEEYKTKIYSKKDAVIKDYDIMAGNILVRRNQFVKKGDILVDDEIVVNEKVKHVGTKGVVYGYVFYRYSFSIQSDIEEYTYRLFDVKKEIMKDYYKGEYIEKEEMQIDNGKMHFFFTAVEILNSY